MKVRWQEDVISTNSFLQWIYCISPCTLAVAKWEAFWIALHSSWGSDAIGYFTVKVHSYFRQMTFLFLFSLLLSLYLNGTGTINNARYKYNTLPLCYSKLQYLELHSAYFCMAYFTMELIPEAGGGGGGWWKCRCFVNSFGFLMTSKSITSCHLH